MNKKPVMYKQYDPKWAKVPYQVNGETTNIQQSGCGPTCAAMLLATLADPNITPVDTCRWSVLHGYKALKQGTYYSYFTPQFAEYGIPAKQLNWDNTYHKPNSINHETVKFEVNAGNYVIACMGPGLWTTGGHFILVWGWENGKVYINDSASSKQSHEIADEKVFKNEVKYYFIINAIEYHKKHANLEGESMYDKISDIPEWGKSSIQKLIDKGLLKGTDSGSLGINETFVKVITVLDRAGII